MITTKAAAWTTFLRVWIAALCLSCLALPASAHSANQSYIYFDVTETTLSGRIEVTLSDLGQLFSGPARAPLTEEETRARQEEIFGYFDEHMQLFFEGKRYDVTFDSITFLPTGFDVFAGLLFTVNGIDVTPTTIEMSYDAIFNDVDPTHRGFGLIGSNTRNGMDENEGYITLIFSPGDGVQTLYLNDEPTNDIIKTFLEHGAWHIWLGFDHVLFLITLLLSSVMVIHGARWEPAERLGASVWTIVKIVTVFTVAHTITLCLATFGIIVLPVVFVEAVIAASIAVVALGNLMPRFHTQSWIIVFVFGLFHGFGFANVLEPLGLDPARKALGLVAFNVGVELGQLVIVLLVFPVFFAIRKMSAYRLVGLQVGSVALIAIALFWFVQRTAGALLPAGDSVARLVN